MPHAQFRELSINMGVCIAVMKIEKVVAGESSLQIFSETPVFHPLIVGGRLL